MSELVLVDRLLVAAVLAIAAVAKLVDGHAVTHTLTSFGVPRRVVPIAAGVLPFVELGLAAALLANATARWAALGAAALLAVFTSAVAYQLARGRRPDCGCFGRLSTGRIGLHTLVRNASLVVLAGFAAAAGPGTDVRALWAAGGADGIVAAAVAAALVFAALNAAFSWQLLKQNGRLWARIAALEEGRS